MKQTTKLETLRFELSAKTHEVEIADGEIERLRAENERLREQNIEADLAWDTKLQAAESRLATATALLLSWLGWAKGKVGRGQLIRDTRSFLATQPAAPSWCEKCNSVRPCPGCTIPAAPARTEAERRVLGAWGKVKTPVLVAMRGIAFFPDLTETVEAELARREAEK